MAREFVKEDALRYDNITRRWVEPASKCSRRTPTVVVCDYGFVDEDSVNDAGNMWGCSGTKRIRETWDFYYGKTLNRDCGYIFSSGE